MDKKIKKYIYVRDKEKCYHCGKGLKISQVNNDHYFPKSKGGSDSYHNLVLSCKKCNKYKSNTVPKDWKAVNIKLFKRAYKDKKMDIALSKVKYNDLLDKISEVDNIKMENRKAIFYNNQIKIEVKDNKIVNYHS